MTLEEVYLRGAEDSIFFSETFFPQTVGMRSPPFHQNVWDDLESDNRLVNLLVFRGGAKTSVARLFTAKRMAYSLSQTIFYVSKSGDHAVRSSLWLRNAVEHNKKFANTYNLSVGSKWTDTEFEVIQTLPDPEDPKKSIKHSIWLVFAGILGNVRGVNLNDRRPDLIVLDDILDDANALTQDQRVKIENLVYGALLESLAPATENPLAKMVSLNTIQDAEDYAVKAISNDEWFSRVYGCWTPKTADLPLQRQESIWPERYPTETLRKEKRNAIRANRLNIFLREKEQRLFSGGETRMQPTWLRRYANAPEGMTIAYAIDPVPPPSKKALEKGLKGNDFEAHVVWGAVGNKKYLLEYILNRGHNPTWTLAQVFRIHRQWNPTWTLVEAVAYQRTLKFLIEEAMKEKQMWFSIEEWDDRRPKFTRITDAHTGEAVAGNLFVREDQYDFLQQFASYTGAPPDDLLDASATALSKLIKMRAYLHNGSPAVAHNQEESEVLMGGCP
jgi:hypothetical protein